jgi:phenylalanine-4-hydroxylase
VTLEVLYQSVRMIRIKDTSASFENFETLKQNHPKDWLLSVEIAEL